MIRIVGLAALEITLLVLLAVLSPDDKPPVAPADAPREMRIQHRAKLQVGFRVQPAENRYAELRQRVRISGVLWNIGGYLDERKYRDQAVGVLDASIPVPGSEPLKRYRCGYSPYGSLEDLVQGIFLEQPVWLYVYTPKELQQLQALISRRGSENGPRYLRVLISDYDRLIKLLKIMLPEEGPDDQRRD